MKEMIKLWAEINALKSENTIQKINETKSWFFWKKSNIDKPVATFTKKGTERSSRYKKELEMKGNKS